MRSGPAEHLDHTRLRRFDASMHILRWCRREPKPGREPAWIVTMATRGLHGCPQSCPDLVERAYQWSGSRQEV